MAQETQVEEKRRFVPAKQIHTEWPLIDSDPHFNRVISYARPSDWWKGLGLAALAPGMMLFWERVSPSHVGKGGFIGPLRLSGAIGLTGAFYWVYQTTSYRFYGAKENAREVEMDMREMVDKVKKGEPLYGKSHLSPYMQGVAARNSRYSASFMHVVPWMNFVHHEQHGVDTAKYYRQAERELEEERSKKA